MDPATSGAASPRPSRGVIACLFLVGAIALGFGVWRLTVWGFGRPEQLLDIGDTRMRLLIEGHDRQIDRAQRDVRAAREDTGATAPQKLAAAEEKLREQEKLRGGLVEAWELQVQGARRGELAYVVIGTGLGAYCLWAGCRLLRARRRLSQPEAPGAH